MKWKVGNAQTFENLQDLASNVQQARKHRAVSLFSGILGLDLGVGGLEAQFMTGHWKSKWCLFEDGYFLNCWQGICNRQLLHCPQFLLLLDFAHQSINE